jgi:hypothetical protein
MKAGYVFRRLRGVELILAEVPLTALSMSMK